LFASEALAGGQLDASPSGYVYSSSQLMSPREKQGK